MTTDTRPAPRHSRWKFYLPLGLAVAALAAYTVVWFSGARIMRAEIDAWIAREQAQGRVVQHGNIAVRGYPGSLRAVIDAPVWLDPDANRAWRADALLVIAQPVRPRTLLLAPRGEQEVVWDGTPYALRADDLRVSLSDEQIAVQAEGLTAEGGGTALALGALRGNWARTEAGEALLFELRDATLTDDAGPLSIAVLRGAASAEANAALRADGFEAALVTAEGERPTRIAGEGALGLAPDGNLSGRMTVTVADPAAVLGLLGSRGVLAADQAALATSVAPMFAGEDGAVVLPLTFEGGQVSAAGFPLARTPLLGG